MFLRTSSYNRDVAAFFSKWMVDVEDAQTADGSWADQNFGPAYATSLALVILQLDNDYVPAFSR